MLDVDYHHGNGTQQIFYERDDVAFVSLHGDPARAYPYHTGLADEIGAGPGRGTTTATCRCPPAPTTTPTSPALDRALAALDAFDPAVVVVSLGVDTYVDDPMCDLALTTDGFGPLGAAVAALGRPLVVRPGGRLRRRCARRQRRGVAARRRGRVAQRRGPDRGRRCDQHPDERSPGQAALMSSSTCAQRSGSLLYGA